MKMKLIIGLLVLAISGTGMAFNPAVGPGILKTFNWETGTAYAGGQLGHTYFRSTTTVIYTQGGVKLEYDNTNPTHHLISDLTVFKDPSAIGVEDTWGLLDVRSFANGSIAPADSTFGDGSDPSLIGNGIQAPAGSTYWTQGNDGEYLRGMLWGGEDQVVQYVGNDIDTGDPIYRIYNANGQFDLFELTHDPLLDPGIDGTLSPSARTDLDDFTTSWFDRTTDRLVMGGEIVYFRFQGQAGLNDIGGETGVLLDVNRGAWSREEATQVFFDDWWQTPEFQQTQADRTGEADSEIWQTWNIGDPGVGAPQNGWILSEDSGRFYIQAVPEPITMLGVMLGVGGLRSYMRKRRLIA